MLNESAILWKGSGLLDGLSEEQSNELAKSFEDLVDYLTSLKKQDAMFGFVLPIIRRLYVQINKPGKFSFIVNVIDLLSDLNEKWIIYREKNKEEIEDKIYVSGSSIDVEAEFVYEYCNNYIEDLKKRGII